MVRATKVMLRLAWITALLAALTAVPSSLWAGSQYPTPTHDRRERIQRTGTCPTGYVGVSAFCEALHANTPRAYPTIPARACPSGTFRSGDACKSFH